MKAGATVEKNDIKDYLDRPYNMIDKSVQDEAVEDLNTAKEIWFEKMLENGFEIPLPNSTF